MKNKIIDFIRHPLISGSAVVFIGSILGNLFHFLFNVFMSRNLSVSEYGILVSLMTLSSFPGYFLHSINPTSVRFATNFITNREYDKLKGLYLQITRVMLVSGLFFAFLFIVFAGEIANFLHIESIGNFVIFLGFIVFFGLLSSVNMAFLQARLSFKYASFLTFLAGLLKLLFGVLFVLAGFRIGGVLVALIAANLLVYAAGLLPLRSIFISQTKAVKIKTKEILSYGATATFVFLSITSFINTDIILVKHFFPAHEAGLYAGLSLIGKVVFFFSAPIGMVMFPLVVKKHTLGQKMHKMLAASLGLVLIPSVLLTLFYFLFPEFTVKFFLKKEEYLAISNLVGLFGIYMTLYSLLHILSNFYLSIKKTNIYIPLTLSAIAQIILIIFLHKSFTQIIAISISITFLLVLGLLLYYPYATKQKL